MGRFNRALRAFAGADRFRGDPVCWAYAQIGHGFVGFGLTAVITWALMVAGGSYPDDAIIAGAVPVAYFIYWEMEIQQSKWADAVEDTAFVGAGASLFWVVDMQAVIDAVTVWVVLVGAALVAGVLRRI